MWWKAEAPDTAVPPFFMPLIFNLYLPGGIVLRVNGASIFDYIGNNDNIANPGEFIELGIGLENIGTWVAYDVTLLASSEDIYLDPYSDIYSYDDDSNYEEIPPGATLIPMEGLWIGIDSYTPQSHVITFDVLIEDIAGNVWNDIFQLTVTGTDTTPPLVDNAEVSPQYLQPGEPVQILVFIVETGTIASVTSEIESPDENVLATLPLYDDGAHGDYLAGDRWYGADYTPAIEADFYVDFSAVDGLGNQGTWDNELFFTTLPVVPRVGARLGYEPYYPPAIFPFVLIP